MLTPSSVRTAARVVGQPLKRFPLGGPWKRLFDVITGGMGLMVSTPILLATAALIRLLLGTPIIVAEERIGYKGRRFNCYAFRTNHNQAGSKRIGRYLSEVLRTSGLDKLPRLFNVVRGEMSLIGPRPIAASELTRYRVQLPEYFFARPGVIETWRYVDRRQLDMARSDLAMDRCYVRNWSMRLDLALFVKVIFACSSRDGSPERDR